MISISDLVKRPDAPLSRKQLLLLDKWLKEDWEAHDMDRKVILLIKRLMLTIDDTAMKWAEGS
jgi:hypothetical protein